ncbi:MAG: adenine phosphoribosyltransferase, partial [Mycoplasma sp.]|nr:adenine phosphoribosyltransferase [Mycoplasma sp.]
MDYKDLKESVISVLDFPKKGIDFKDITPIFLDYKKVDFILEEMVSFAKTLDFDVVVAPE